MICYKLINYFHRVILLPQIDFNDKSVDGVLGMHRIVGADKSTELWWHPKECFQGQERDSNPQPKDSVKLDWPLNTKVQPLFIGDTYLGLPKWASTALTTDQQRLVLRFEVEK